MVFNKISGKYEDVIFKAYTEKNITKKNSEPKLTQRNSLPHDKHGNSAKATGGGNTISDVLVRLVWLSFVHLRERHFYLLTTSTDNIRKIFSPYVGG